MRLPGLLAVRLYSKADDRRLWPQRQQESDALLNQAGGDGLQAGPRSGTCRRLATLRHRATTLRKPSAPPPTGIFLSNNKLALPSAVPAA